MLVLAALSSALSFGGSAFSRHAVTSAPRAATAVAAASVPDELQNARWVPEFMACCSMGTQEGDGDGEARLVTVLEWLQVMLVNLELGTTEELDGPTEEEDELDEDFVSEARPWLHAKAFHDITGEAGFTQRMWNYVVESDYLQQGGKGGTLLLLLPSRLPYSLFSEVTDDTMAAVQKHVNADIVIAGCHPDAPAKQNQAPVPLLRIFLDSPDLLVEGGSMSDAAGFL